MLCVLIFVVSFLVLIARTREHFDAPSHPFISVRHTYSSQIPLTIAFPEYVLPCSVPVATLRSIKEPFPLVPTPVTDRLCHTCDVSCSDVVSLWMLNTNSSSDCVIAACPQNDLVLSIVACLGAGHLPPTPLVSSGLTFYDVANSEEVVVCSGPLEQRLFTDICACASPPMHIQTTLDITSIPIAQRILVFMRPAGHVDVDSALQRSNAVKVQIPTLNPFMFAIAQPLAKLRGNGDGSAIVSSTTVLVGRCGLSDDPRINTIVRALTNIDQFWSLAELNYASQYLPILASTRNHLRALDRVALTRSRLSKIDLSDSFYGISATPILREGFSKGSPTPVTLTSVQPLEAYMTHTSHGGLCRVLELRMPFVGAAWMRIGDRVILSNQSVKKHDGEFIVQSLQSGDQGTVVVTWFETPYSALTFTDVYPTSLEEKGLTASITMSASIASLSLWPSSTSMHVGDRLLLNNLSNPDGSLGVWTTVTAIDGTSVTVQTLSQKPPHASCVSSPTTEIKSVCLSEDGLWDAPCTSDDHCPFFQSNTHYANYRGGCLDSGWCEMPVGVAQTSYRNATGIPAVHANRESDIAFPLDQFERRAFGLT